MTIQISTKVAEAIVAAATGQLDTGSAEPSARLIIWSGPVPASPDVTIDVSGKLLADTFLPNPAFGAPAVVSLGESVEALAFAVPQFTAVDEGQATFFRLYDREGDVCVQGIVSDDPADNAPLTINQTAVVEGAVLTVQRLVIGVNLV